ncbi:glycosyltransferase [Schumannella soli]|uniref:Glycosyltransferase family 4 protein n=1 Tax=Schumannella soli TaxID=2590779 RepID=A0A506Y5F6_9MICO|nr:glycosyltransferase [Schumannella soli]TPW77232.1 glycosyltransferase family 4 protein [Schumannella soli]
MTPATEFLDSAALFRVVRSDDFTGLTLRQRRLLVAAANYHALDSADAEVRLRILIAGPGRAAVLTHPFGDAPPSASDATEAGRIEVTVADAPTRQVERHVIITPDDVTPQPPQLGLRARYWRARQQAERRFPLAYDRLRQTLLSRRERHLSTTVIERASGSEIIEELAGVGPAASSDPVVIVGMHWLELGGAESWAIETVRAVVEAGILPVVFTDRYSEHPFITADLFRDVVVMPFAGEVPAAGIGDEPLRQIVERYDVRGVLVHHCGWLYDRLAWIRENRPGVPVVDSLHIVEYAGGGYPATAVHVDPFVTTHHVISPELERWMTVNQQVPREKVVMAPLVGLTVADGPGPTFSPRPDRPFTIAFVGRFVRQKRPYLFVRLVARLVRAGVPVRAILHGSGELEEVTRERVRTAGLDGVVEFRGHDHPVSGTLADADLLVVASQNEGLTLTTIEAVSAGVPTLSTDVGSQRTVIAPSLLVSRDPTDFLAEATSAIRDLAGAEAERERAWRDELALLEALSKHQAASAWIREEVRGWLA